MSREIKFRAWDERGQTWITFDLNDAMSGRIEREGYSPLRLINKRQYTGLLDKHGVEIYEGDVVNIIHPAWTECCKVIFDRGAFTLYQLRPVVGGHSLVRMSVMELWPESDNWKLEVIGNIHENPELLNKE